MNLSDLISRSKKPTIYEDGTAFMWTDDHISKQLLEIHLNPELDLASRKKSSIKRTISWILEGVNNKKKLNILDLGCGPGLYTEMLAQNGHKVSGVDISRNSIDYAKNSAKRKNLEINYINSNYINLDFEPDYYDLIIMIFTDLGVLKPEDREILLKSIYKALKSGGTFIFDVLKDNDIDKKLTPKNWECKDKGFWKNDPYLLLSESYLYDKEKVILFQHHVIDEYKNMETYRFWTHFFSKNDLENLLKPYQYSSVNFGENVLAEDGIWNGNNVIFTKAVK